MILESSLNIPVPQLVIMVFVIFAFDSSKYIPEDSISEINKLLTVRLELSQFIP